MEFKKSIIMLILTIFLFSIASVCASDVDDTLMASENTQAIEEVQNDVISVADDNQPIQQTDDEEIISEGEVGTFTDLRNKIETAHDGGTITLDMDYEADESGEIILVKSITLDGKGHTIDAKEKTRVFNVQANNVVIKNLTINNAKSDEIGGAICFWGTSGTAKNCNFTNNTATYGGAVWMMSGTVENCNFSNNNATDWNGNGGAIYFYNKGTVRNCNFNNNKIPSDNGYGGAIYFKSGSGSTVTDCNFTDNTARNGGAIYFDEESAGSVINSNFTNNKAAYNGGAIYYWNGKATNCYFKNNKGNLYGGAIFFKNYGTADSCIFKTGSDSTNQANILPPTLDFDTIIVAGETVTLDLKTNGGMRINNGNIIINVYYKNNDSWVGNYSCLSGQGWNACLPAGIYYAVIKTEYKGFQPINRTITIVPENSFTALNKTINGNDNAIINLTTDYYFYPAYDEAFVNGININRKVTINGNGHIIDAKTQSSIFYVEKSNTTLKNMSFVNSNSYAVYLTVFATNTTISGCRFIKNGGSMASAITWVGEGGSVSDCIFINNSVGHNGGAINWNGKGGHISNSTFINNTAGISGGAIYWNQNEGNVSNCVFINNTAHNSGGAIYFSSPGTVENCNFTNNVASQNGGAVYFSNNGYVTNCNFMGNNATTGSAIYFLSTSSTKAVLDSTFLNNRANVDANTPLQIETEGNKIKITFIGQDNLLNAIYSNAEVSFTNVTYWGANGIANTGKVTTKPSLSNKEAGQNITVTVVVNDILILNTTEVTDENGTIVLDYVAGNYVICHDADSYYNYAEKRITIIPKNSFTALNQTINGNDNAEINLTMDYYFDPFYDEAFVNGIVINRKVTINGNGHAIEANGKARAFDVQTSDVIIKNLNINNAKCSNDVGGAVYFSAPGTVENCNFTNNKATYGSAVYFNENGEVRNCNFTNNTEGGAIYFGGSTGSVENCNFTNNKATYGGAVYFNENGEVTNCNFTNNDATYGGAVYFNENGEVTNCNFTNNTARNGGAIEFDGTGTITDCNFANNHAYEGGAVYFEYSSTGTVANCNFANNTADEKGGAVYFYNHGKVTDCNFTGNNATIGSAIYFKSSSASSSVSNSCFLNNRANVDSNSPLTIEIIGDNIEITFKGQDNLINAIYSGNEVTFTNVTYWGADGITNTDDSYPSRSNNEVGQNITVSGYVNGNILNTVKTTDANGKIILENVIGDYWISVRHNRDSYYTDAETIIANMAIYVNVCEIKATNRTVNITAKSNIKHEVMPGELVFILEDGTQITAAYASNGTWWAVYTFADYGDHKVNASYTGLDNVVINNATITISKTDSTISIVVPELNYGTSVNVTVNTTGAIGIIAEIYNGPVLDVNGFVIIMPDDLDAGEYVMVVTTIPDEDHNAVSKNATITVRKTDSTISVGDITFDYGGSGSAAISFTGATDIIAEVVNQAKAVVTVNGTNIIISNLDAGTYTLKVTTIADANHNTVTKTANITVKKLGTTVTASNKVYVINYGGKYSVIIKDANGKVLSGKKVTFTLNGKNIGSATTNANGVATITLTAKILKAVKAGKKNLVVKFTGDANYNGASKTVKITINKEKTKIKAKKKTFKRTKKVKKYTIKLKNSKGKAVKKVKVTIKIKGKTYKAKTNKKGKAVFKIKKLTKKGTFKATIKFKGNKYYKAVTKKVKIRIK